MTRFPFVLRSRRIAPFGTERLVEIPWVISRYQGERNVLDVGSAFAESEYIDQLAALGILRLVGVDLAPPRQATPPPFEVVQGDVRQLPFPDHSFDLVLCISTLEHIGRDNSIYGLPVEHDPGGMLAALREFRRVLAVRGRVLVTVPCGETEDHGWFLQQPAHAWLRLFTDAGFAITERRYSVLAADGWRWRRQLSPRGLRYGDRGPAASAVLCAELRQS